MGAEYVGLFARRHCRQLVRGPSSLGCASISSEPCRWRIRNPNKDVSAVERSLVGWTSSSEQLWWRQLCRSRSPWRQRITRDWIRGRTPGEYFRTPMTSDQLPNRPQIRFTSIWKKSCHHFSRQRTGLVDIEPKSFRLHLIRAFSKRNMPISPTTTPMDACGCT